MSEIRKQAMYKRAVISDSIEKLEAEVHARKCDRETQNRIIRAEDRKESNHEAA